MKLAHMLRTMWAVFGVVAAVLLVLASAVEALIFTLAYNGPAGSYAGQAGDRQLAWRLLIMLAVLWVFVPVAMLWPAVRWRRRGMFSPPEPEQQAAGQAAPAEQADR